jgi:hypothetical protein
MTTYEMIGLNRRLVLSITCAQCLGIRWRRLLIITASLGSHQRGPLVVTIRRCLV